MVNEGHHLPLEYGGRSGVGSHHRSGVKAGECDVNKGLCDVIDEGGE